MHIEMIAAAANLGGPKWNGAEMPIQAESATEEKSTRPIGMAMIVPRTIEISTAVWPTKPRNSREIATIMRMTTAASTMCEIWPASGFMAVTI